MSKTPDDLRLQDSIYSVFHFSKVNAWWRLWGCQVAGHMRLESAEQKIRWLEGWEAGGTMNDLRIALGVEVMRYK
jgi:hypothetical protein